MQQLTGQQLSLIPEISPYPLSNPAPESGPLSPEQPQQSNRRHSQRGQASGWIEERQGNRKRQTPSVSYYYCWLDAEGQRRKRYITIGKLYWVNIMVADRRLVTEILMFLGVKP